MYIDMPQRKNFVLCIIVKNFIKKNICIKGIYLKERDKRHVSMQGHS